MNFLLQNKIAIAGALLLIGLLSAKPAVQALQHASDESAVSASATTGDTQASADVAAHTTTSASVTAPAIQTHASVHVRGDDDTNIGVEGTDSE